MIVFEVKLEDPEPFVARSLGFIGNPRDFSVRPNIASQERVICGVLEMFRTGLDHLADRQVDIHFFQPGQHLPGRPLSPKLLILLPVSVSRRAAHRQQTLLEHEDERVVLVLRCHGHPGVDVRVGPVVLSFVLALAGRIARLGCEAGGAAGGRCRIPIAGSKREGSQGEMQ